MLPLGDALGVCFPRGGDEFLLFSHGGLPWCRVLVVFERIVHAGDLWVTELDGRDRMRYAEVKECGADNGLDNR